MKTPEQIIAARKKAASILGKGSAAKRLKEGTLQAHMALVRAGKLKKTSKIEAK